MIAKKSLILLICVLTVFLVGCQIPQYNPQEKAEDDDITAELEEIIADIEGEEGDEPETMSEEELAREEFKQKLFDKQKEAQEGSEDSAEESEDVEATEESDDVEDSEEEVEDSTETKLTLTVKEGETVELKPKAEDPDGDKLSFSFGKPLDEKGTWVTEIGDAGNYCVEVSVSDGKVTVTDTVKIVVQALNHAPVIEPIGDITVKEGELVSIEVKASDEDGDKLTYTFSGWMESSTYTTNYNDAGEHTVTVEVSDGKASVSEDVTVTVEDVNRPPVLIWG